MSNSEQLTRVCALAQPETAGLDAFERLVRNRIGKRAGTRSASGTPISNLLPTSRRLSEALPGATVEVTEIAADEPLRGRLIAMGIVPGARLSVVLGGRGLPFVLALPGSQIVIDSDSSGKVLVSDPGPDRGSEGNRP